MTITKDDASQALSEIDAARGRVWQAKAYSHASPFLIIWGAVWMVADGLTQFEPTWGLSWLVCIALGAIASTVVGASFSRQPDADRRVGGWRQFATWLVVVAFIISLFFVIPVSSNREVHSIFGLVFGFIYLGMGLWIGWRLAALGVALVALTLAGFYAVGAWYALYMGLVSGGALVLGGLWLRRL
jgi:hypothetical protein